MINIGNVDLAPSENIIEIRDKKQVIKARYVMDSKDIHKQDLMSEHYIEISFQLDISVKFVRGDYIMIEGSKFMLRKKHKPTQVNKHKFTYTLKFEAREMLAQDAKLYYIRQNLKEATWSLTSDAPSFVKIAVDSLNRYLGKNEFQVGLVEPIGTKLINFDDLSVWDGLVEMAKVFEGEFYFTGNILNLVNKFSYGSEIEFENEVSVASMSQSEGENSNDFNRIVALGSTRNIPANYRETSSGEGVDAIYQKRLRIPVSKGDVIDAYTDMSPEEIVEGSVIFEDVYPKRVGTMSNITTVDAPEEDEETGEITYWKAFRYKDTGLNFKEEYILPGKELRIYFQKSKRLNGLDFAVKFNPDGKPESSPDAQVFEIVRNEDYGKALPNENLYPEAGDEYILYGFNIQLVSDAYVPAAEEELYERAVEWLANNIKDTSVFECPTVIQHFAVNSMDLEIGQKVQLINSLFDAGYRSSRIMGFEKKLINKYDAVYTVGDNAAYSRLSSIEKQIDELKYAGQIYQQTGSSGVYVIKQFDTTTPTDFNVYSAKASNAKYLKRDQEDSALRKITFADGIDVKKGAVSDMFGNDTFTSGQFGSGFRMWKADNGQSYAELDNLLVRREMIINTLTIAEIKSVGGQILVSLANMYVTKVEELADSYRCYFDTDNGTIQNQFALDDQVICRKFNGQGIKYYWSRVLGIGSDYIRLSKVDKDGSGIPSEGDELIQFGNRTNAARQSAIMISAYGSDAPSIKQYGGINTYNLTGKEVTVISPSGNKFTGQFQISTNGTTSVVYKDRGSFSNVATYYLNDRISYNGAYWVCIAPEGQSTSEIPSTTALYWRQDTTSQGDVNNAVDNIQIGGRNYLRQDNYLIGDYITNTVLLPPGEYIATCYNCKFENIHVDGYGFLFSNKFKIDEEKTVTIYALWGSHTSVPLNQIKCKIEQGNKSTDWTLAPEDVQNGIDNAQNTADSSIQRVTVAESNISVLQGEIKQTVKQSEFNSLEGRVSTSESNIIQQAGLIASTVEKVDKKNSVYTSYTNDSNDRPKIPYAKNDIWIKKDGRIFQSQNTRLSGNFIESDWIETVPSANDFQIGGRNYLRQNNYVIGDYITNTVLLPPGEYIATCYNCKFENIHVDGYGFLFSNKFKIDEEKAVTIYAFWGSHTSVPLNQIKCKIEQGNKSTDWTPAPEDVQTGIDNAQNTADSKIRTFYSDIQPSTPNRGFKEGDLWYKINIVDGCYETYRWQWDSQKNKYDWVVINVNVSKTKIQQTDNQIDLIATKEERNNVGVGKSLIGQINVKADEIELSVKNIQVGGRNYLRQNNYVIGDYITNTVLLPPGEYIATCYNCKFENIRVDGYGFLFSNKFTIDEEKAVTIYALWGSHTSVPLNQIKCKIEQGNKSTDWTLAPEDVKEDVRTSLVLNENGIWLNGDTIAQAIRAKSLDVGNGNFHVGTDGIISAKGANISGTINADKGSIGGFDLSNNRIGVSVDPNTGDTYGGLALYNEFIKFSQGLNIWAGIGTNVFPASSGLRVLARFENKESNPYSTNYALIANASNGFNNIAIKGIGNIVSDGLSVGYKFDLQTPPANTATIPKYYETCIAKFIYSNSGIGLPSKSSVQDQLGISSTEPFSVRYTIITSSSSTQTGTIWGRNTTISNMSSTNYPQRLNNDGNVDTRGLAMGKGDICEFQLVFDGINYQAYLLNHRN